MTIKNTGGVAKNHTRPFTILAVFLVFGLSSCVGLQNPKAASEEKPVATETCKGFWLQTPRDIDNKNGLNKQLFSIAPRYHSMNLCNIHFHVNAEHKAKDFSIYAGEGENGHGGGYKCTGTTLLTKEELKAPKEPVCENLKPGDTIEVHWVHSSCDVKPGEGLGACSSATCSNPDLRVETQVFLVVNDPAAVNFNNLNYSGGLTNGKHQAKALPEGTGIPVEFLGSTTGEKYDNQKCSPLQVTWSVRPNTIIRNVRRCKSHGASVRSVPKLTSTASANGASTMCSMSITGMA